MDATVTVTTPDGTTTGPIPLSALKKAASKTDRKRKPEPADDQVEAFSQDETGEASVNGVSRQMLRSFVERIERLDEEKKVIADDIKQVFGEAKGMGFDKKALRRVIAIRKQDRDEWMEHEAIVTTYLVALGMAEDEAGA